MCEFTDVSEHREAGRTLSMFLVVCVCWSMVAFLFAGPASALSSPVLHVWEKKELRFTATRDWDNPYVQVTFWVDLAGPGFQKRVFGFWDGQRTYFVDALNMADIAKQVNSVLCCPAVKYPKLSEYICSHTFSVWSHDAETTRSPSGFTATAVTESVWPLGARKLHLLPRSHTQIALAFRPRPSRSSMSSR